MNSSKETTSYKPLRRCILLSLYDFFKKHPYGLAELRSIEEICCSNVMTLNWNLVYLDKCGYIELDKSQDCPPYISCTVSITAKGIDLVEDTPRFDSIFPA